MYLFQFGNILCGLSVAVIIGVFYVLSLMFEDPEVSAISFNLILATSHKLVMGLMVTIWTLGIVLKFNGNLLFNFFIIVYFLHVEWR